MDIQRFRIGPAMHWYPHHMGVYRGFRLSFRLCTHEYVTPHTLLAYLGAPHFGIDRGRVSDRSCACATHIPSRNAIAEGCQSRTCLSAFYHLKCTQTCSSSFVNVPGVLLLTTWRFPSFELAMHETPAGLVDADGILSSCWRTCLPCYLHQ